MSRTYGNTSSRRKLRHDHVLLARRGVGRMLPNRYDSHLSGRLFVAYKLVQVSRTLENSEDEINCANCCFGNEPRHTVGIY